MSRVQLIAAALVAGAFMGLAVGFATPAAATTILEDHGSYTVDTSTGLAWLDLTETTNLSYNDVHDDVFTSFMSQGWRFATAAELSQLFADVGVTSVDIGDDVFTSSLGTNPTYEAGALLVSLLGSTQTFLYDLFPDPVVI